MLDTVDVDMLDTVSRHTVLVLEGSWLTVTSPLMPPLNSATPTTAPPAPCPAPCPAPAPATVM